MKQQALDGSLHCPDHSCGLDDDSPAALGTFDYTIWKFTNTFI